MRPINPSDHDEPGDESDEATAATGRRPADLTSR